MTLLYLAASWLLLSMLVAAVLCAVARTARHVGESVRVDAELPRA